MTSKSEHLWRTGLLLVATIAAACGAYFIRDEMVKGIAVGVLTVAAGGLLDALRVLARGSGDGGSSAVLLVLCLPLLGGCGYSIAAIAAASDAAEEACMRAPDSTARDACIGCVRATTDAIVCRLDDAACAELTGE